MRADRFSLKERSETNVIKIENGEQPILGLDANFEFDQSVHMRTRTENIRSQDLVEQLNLTQHK